MVLCDTLFAIVQELNRRLLISNDFYIRTTMPDHHREAQKLWTRYAC
jgi:methionyl-tRNA synthetase